jgi:hypothetical protein
MRLGSLAAELPLDIPSIGFAAEVVKLPEHPQAQAHSILPGSPFWAENAAKLWVQSRFAFQEQLDVPVSKLAGFVRCGQVIALSHDMLAVNTDAPIHTWMYGLVDGTLAWTEVVVETSG